MTERHPGYFWVNWTDRADADLIERRPAPLIGEWDGRVWWFARMPAYRFDCEVRVLAECPVPEPIVSVNGARAALGNPERAA